MIESNPCNRSIKLKMDAGWGSIHSCILYKRPFQTAVFKLVLILR
jgi:hypothetical protein